MPRQKARSVIKFGIAVSLFMKKLVLVLNLFTFCSHSSRIINLLLILNLSHHVQISPRVPPASGEIGRGIENHRRGSKRATNFCKLTSSMEESPMKRKVGVLIIGPGLDQSPHSPVAHNSRPTLSFTSIRMVAQATKS